MRSKSSIGKFLFFINSLNFFSKNCTLFLCRIFFWNDSNIVMIITICNMYIPLKWEELHRRRLDNEVMCRFGKIYSELLHFIGCCWKCGRQLNQIMILIIIFFLLCAISVMSIYILQHKKVSVSIIIWDLFSNSQSISLQYWNPLRIIEWTNKQTNKKKNNLPKSFQVYIICI